MKKIFVTTSWDDGHILDIKLANLLKKYGIKGTFYVSPKNREIHSSKMMSAIELKKLSEDFEIGAHTMTHPHLTKITDETARREIVDSKKHLERVTGGKIDSFCYPAGFYNKKHIKMVEKAGFSFARNVKRFKTELVRNNLNVPTTIHAYRHWSDLFSILLNVGPKNFVRSYLNWDVLAKIMFDKIVKNGGVFHVWGHSWEIDKNNDWEKLESVLKYISNRKDVLYVNNIDLISHE